MSDNQAQADTPAQPTVEDPLDAANSLVNGTKLALDDFMSEVRSTLSQPENDQPQGEQSVEIDEEREEQEPAQSEQEVEEQEEEEAGDSEPEAKASGRYRFKSADDIAVASIAKAKGISLVEAAKLYAGDSSAPQSQETSQQATEQAADPNAETYSSVTEALKGLRAQKKELLASLDFEGAAELEDQIDDLLEKKSELRLLEERNKSQAQQAEADQFYAAYEKSEDKAIQFYPSAADPNSDLNKEIVRLNSEMEQLGDPLFHSPDKPFILTQKAAVKLGIPMEKPGSTPPKKTVQHRPMQPAGGNARTTTTDPAKRTLEAIEGLKTVDDYRAAVASLGR